MVDGAGYFSRIRAMFDYTRYKSAYTLKETCLIAWLKPRVIHQANSGTEDETRGLICGHGNSLMDVIHTFPRCTFLLSAVFGHLFVALLEVL